MGEPLGWILAGSYNEYFYEEDGEVVLFSDKNDAIRVAKQNPVDKYEPIEIHAAAPREKHVKWDDYKKYQRNPKHR